MELPEEFLELLFLFELPSRLVLLIVVVCSL
jgi:hypothetical protein